MTFKIKFLFLDNGKTGKFSITSKNTSKHCINIWDEEIEYERIFGRAIQIVEIEAAS